MIARISLPLLFLLSAGCAASIDDEAPVSTQLACAPQRDVANRASPYDSVRFAVADGEGLVCYGRPSARGRTMLGERLPFGQLWRTGANEPTILHLDRPARIAGIEVEPGSYSIYSLPGETEWTIIVNRSISQWGHENSYTPDVRAQEVGRAPVPASAAPSYVETFTIDAEPADNGADLVLQWENTRVVIPVRPLTR